MAGEELPPPAEAGEAFADVILRACAYDRHDRYESAEEFRMALERVRYPGQPELSDIRKPEIISDPPETARNFTEEEKPEETVTEKYRQKDRQKNQPFSTASKETCKEKAEI